MENKILVFPVIPKTIDNKQNRNGNLNASYGEFSVHIPFLVTRSPFLILLINVAKFMQGSGNTSNQLKGRKNLGFFFYLYLYKFSTFSDIS